MVRGLDKFKEYFEQYFNNYIIIGGTACDIIIDEAGFIPRATKDIDIILVVEALNPDFVKQFWKFIQDGDYEGREKSVDKRKYYRFLKPANKEFPYQIELFSRIPDMDNLGEPAYLTPIPTGEDLSSLSAILLNDEYYKFILEHSSFENGIHRANTEALICLKAKAYLEISERIKSGSKEDSRQASKHKGDIFRLIVMLTPSDSFTLPEAIRSDMQAFADSVSDDLPDKAIFKEMGLGNMNVNRAFDQLIGSLKLTIQK
jgi:hypothetical protein